MIDILTLIIVGLVFVQPNLERAIVAAMFASMTFIHNFFMFNLDGLWYYGSDAIFYAIVISITASLPNIPKLTIDIHKICLAAIALDAFGWVIWMLYLPPAPYNVAFMLLYAWTIIILLRGEQGNVGANQLDWGGNIIRPHACARDSICIGRKEAP